MHSPIKDLALSNYTEVAPLARTAGEPTSWRDRLRAHLVAWRQDMQARRELAGIEARDWAVGDFGINRWEADALLARSFWARWAN